MTDEAIRFYSHLPVAFADRPWARVQVDENFADSLIVGRVTESFPLTSTIDVGLLPGGTISSECALSRLSIEVDGERAMRTLAELLRETFQRDHLDRMHAAHVGQWVRAGS